MEVYRQQPVSPSHEKDSPILPLFVTRLSSLVDECHPRRKRRFFYPSDERLQKIYGGGAIYGGELSWRFYKILDLYADAMFFSKSGKSLGERRSTHIRILPVGIGLKGSLPFDPFEIYVAASAKHFTVKIHNNSPYVDQHQEKNGWGWGAKIGVSFFFANHFLLDLFLEYMRKEFSFSHSKKVESRKEVDIGGGVIGGALGYRF